MLSEKDLRIMVREHQSILDFAPICADGREFYKTRLELLLFILEAEPRCQEPPTNNAVINDYLEDENAQK